MKAVEKNYSGVTHFDRLLHENEVTPVAREK
jgi:hypothetical protein